MTLYEKLCELNAAATPGAWNPKPQRLRIPLSDGRIAEGPMMSYLVGDAAKPEGMKVSLGSERIADHQFVAALVNAFRSGELLCHAAPGTTLKEGK